MTPLFVSYFSTQGVHAKPVPFAVFGSLATVCAVSFLFLKETTNKPLPDRLHIRGEHSAGDNCEPASTPAALDELPMTLMQQNRNRESVSMADADLTELVRIQPTTN